jgi:hypothetical protein
MFICSIFFVKYNYNHHIDQVEDEMGGACRAHWEKANTYRLLVGKSERKRPLEKPSRAWPDNIKTNLAKIG